MKQLTNSVKKQTADTKLVQKIAQQDKKHVLKELDTSLDGLSAIQVTQHREKWGKNELENKSKNTKWHFLVQSFMTPFTLVLLLLAVISLCTDYLFVPDDQKDLSTVIIMLVMVFISGIISFIQNVRTNDSVENLLNMISDTTGLKRDGQEKEMSTKELVVGDIVNVTAGDIVPADIRLLGSKDLFCSSASLNGESEPVEKNANQKPVADNLEDYLDYPNVIYEGTTIVSGSGVGVVFATGERTIFGKLAQNISRKEVKETTFDKGIKNISKLLLTMTAIIAPLVFIINGLTKGNWLNALIFAIATAVGLTPEMLPVIVTSNLVKGSVELSKHDTIVKRMNSMQNFGAIDILCTDKTGTLTQEQVILNRFYNLNLQSDKNILELAYLNSFYQTGNKNLIDKAIVKAAKVIDTDGILMKYSKVDELPFDFKRRRLSICVDDGQKQELITKGAAEEMLACANRIKLDQAILPLTAQERDKILENIKTLNEDGFRVVLLGYKPLENVTSISVEDEDNLILCGILAFIDPPKTSAKSTMKQLKVDGITVKILTGDNAAVTRNVAKQVGLDADKVYSEKDFAGKTDSEMKKMVEECDIFVKLSPEMKARIIELLKENQHSVAYMGDGINDASAMKSADVAISVDSGADIAKKCADIILLKKDLHVLEQGVRIGRQVFGNTMKYIKITLSSNFGNILSILVASSFLPFLPMLPIQLLVLDLMYGTSCLSIPFDKMSNQYLKKPRKWKVDKLPKFMLCLGPTSSVFDIITFSVLYFVVCPQVVGSSYALASSSQKTVFAAVFCTGWFIESLWTQEMIIHVLRAPGMPFIKQHATWIVTLATIGIASVGTIIPFTSLGRKMDFGNIPVSYLAIVFVILVVYLLFTTLVKRVYLKHEEYLI
ncbi:magnesium-translocating P-type ATPase [Lactobacillus colini]|nr:magnesium-translocating P-type ATPase [Lactobacillus colini]